MCLGVLCATPAARAADSAAASRPTTQKGTVRFVPQGDQHEVPERYRLGPHTFDYQLAPLRELPVSGVDIFRLTFPSPVTSDCEQNNTVHAEFYRPRGLGPYPGVVILDITGGDQSLSRLIARTLAQNHIAGLFVQMAYYGPRRPPGSRLRLLSPNVRQTLDAVRQTVLDVRRAAAWLEVQPEIDPKRLGILGTSLGSMVGALCAEMEPRLTRVAILLGGGGLVDAFWDHPQARSLRKAFEALGGKKEQLVQMIAPADPLTCAANLKEHKVLIVAGKRDEIVPPSATVRLWEASGKQKIVWYDCTHYGAALFFVPALGHILPHFAAP
jgi:dienelactone hydrolase